MFYENPDFDNENEDGTDDNGNCTPSFGGVGKFIVREVKREVVSETFDSVRNFFSDFFGGDDDD